MINGNHSTGSDYAFNLYNVSGVTIKGFIIGGFTDGIEIDGNSHNNTIIGNYIGCNYNATDTLSNTEGIEIMVGPYSNIIGGAITDEKNIVSGNRDVGIRAVNSNSNIIKGNYVGLNRTGNAAIKNTEGISIEGTSKYNIIGGYTVAERNYVSGNDAYGITIYGDYNIIVGNFVGTDITGTDSIPNTYGVLFDEGACYNRLGGTITGAGNLMSGNSGYGVFIYNLGTLADTVVGNLIGTDVTGTLPLPNTNGMVIDGIASRHYIDSNVISANRQCGIDIHISGTDSNVIVRNKIGTDITGIQALGNTIDGIRIAEGGQYNRIGLPGKGNIIAYNGGNGITLMTAADLYNTISENSIYSNGALGIDLYPAGINANDAGSADTAGPNDLMNFPVIQNVNLNAISGITSISGTIDYTIHGGANGIRIELFKSDNNASGYGEGKEFIGYAIADGSVNWSFNCACFGSNDIVTSTATDLRGNTSEFSLNSSVITSVNDIPMDNNLMLYPNPASSILVVEFSDEKFQNAGYKITNAIGEILLTGNLKEMKNTININPFAQGVYFLQLNTRNGIYTRKIIKC
jgi:parallel beta-helix repeat protein